MEYATRVGRKRRVVNRKGIESDPAQERFARLPENDVGWVYILEAVGCDGVYKIGWARDPLKRIRFLQAGSPFELKLHAVLEGSRKEESQLHWNVKSNRVPRGGREWFYWTSREEVWFHRDQALTILSWPPPDDGPINPLEPNVPEPWPILQGGAS